MQIAVMGCEVNGPGEAKDADIGIAAGPGRGLLFCKGKQIGWVPHDKLVEALIEEAERVAAEIRARRRRRRGRRQGREGCRPPGPHGHRDGPQALGLAFRRTRGGPDGKARKEAPHPPHDQGDPSGRRLRPFLAMESSSVGVRPERCVAVLCSTRPVARIYWGPVLILKPAVSRSFTTSQARSEALLSEAPSRRGFIGGSGGGSLVRE